MNASAVALDTLGYSCTFEQDYETGACGGITIINYPDGFTWTWFSGSTPSLTTGPDWDHTLGPNVTTGTQHTANLTSSYLLVSSFSSNSVDGTLGRTLHTWLGISGIILVRY